MGSRDYGSSITIQDIPWHPMYSRLSINTSCLMNIFHLFSFTAWAYLGVLVGRWKPLFRVWLCFNVFFREGNGTPLQYSCLENPMDGGAWKTAVHGVAEGQTWLSDFTFTFHFHALEKEIATHSSILAWRIPGTGKPGGLPSVGSHRVGHDWSDLAAAAHSLAHDPLPPSSKLQRYMSS